MVGEPMEQKRLPLLLLLLAGGGGVADVMVIEVGGWIIIIRASVGTVGLSRQIFLTVHNAGVSRQIFTAELPPKPAPVPNSYGA